VVDCIMDALTAAPCSVTAELARAYAASSAGTVQHEIAHGGGAAAAAAAAAPPDLKYQCGYKRQVLPHNSIRLSKPKLTVVLHMSALG